MFKRSILILAASCMMYSCATQTESNPFLTEFQTPNGVPPLIKSNWSTTSLHSLKE